MQGGSICSRVSTCSKLFASNICICTECNRMSSPDGDVIGGPMNRHTNVLLGFVKYLKENFGFL